MRESFSLTNGSTMMTAVGTQFISQAVDISSYTSIELVLTVTSVVPSVAASTAGVSTISILTGIQSNSVADFFRLRYFPSFNVGSVVFRTHIATGLLNFIIWNLSIFGANTKSITFSIDGVGQAGA